ncbi:MAG: FeoA family protein [Myxococcota bacterium]
MKARSSNLSAADLRPGELGTITAVLGSGPVRQRLLDMGLLPGTRIQVERVALTGDPIWIRTDGVQVSLRRKEACTVSVRG